MRALALTVLIGAGLLANSLLRLTARGSGGRRAGRRFFLAFHVFTRYVKVTFFRGTSLRPVPPRGTSKDARWVDVHEDDLDEAQLAAWVKQAAALPGWVPGRPD